MKQSRSKTSLMGRWMVGVTFLAAFAASVFLLSGCGEAPVSPTVDQSGLDALHYVDHLNAGPAGVVPLVIEDDGTGTMNEEGGSVSCEFGSNEASLEVPAGALEESVAISMDGTQFQTPWGEVTVFEFGPDGLEFKEAATLTLETNRAEGATLRLFWWNPDTSRWEYQEKATVTAGKVEFPIHHFSKYGIG